MLQVCLNAEIVVYSKHTAGFALAGAACRLTSFKEQMAANYVSASLRLRLLMYKPEYGKEEDSMCGRFQMDESALKAVERIASVPKAVQQQLRLGTIFPSQDSLVLVAHNHQLKGTLMKFGYQSESMKKRIINARSETARQKPLFRYALKEQRCIVPCSLFYEWDSARQQMSFFDPDAPVLYLAGIYKEGQFIILTTNANGSMERYHSRMPLILPEEEAAKWVLDPQQTDTLLKTKPILLDHRMTRPQNQQISLF